MKLGGVKKTSEQKSENEPIKKYKKVVKTSTNSNRGLSVLLACMGVAIVGLVVAIVVVAVNRNNGKNDDGAEDGEVVYASPIYESYDQLAEEFAGALLEMEDPTTQQILDLYQTYLGRTDNEEVKAMLLVDYYMIMMSGDSDVARKTEVLDGLVAADRVVKSVKSASAVAVAAKYYDDTELMAYYQALADARAFGDDDANENEEGTAE